MALSVLRVHCLMGHLNGKRRDGIVNVKISLSYEPLNWEGGGWYWQR